MALPRQIPGIPLRSQYHELRTDVVYNHFAYVPLVLAGVWWGRKGALLAIPLLAVTWAAVPVMKISSHR